MTFIPQTSCPNCQKKIWKLTTKSGIGFCPYCKVNLYTSASKLKTEVKKPINKWFALIISVSMGLSVYFCFLFKETLQNNANFQRFVNALFALLIFFIVWTIAKSVISFFRSSESRYLVGVDTLEEVTEDSCNYTPYENSIKPCQCQECQSFRLVDMYWFKRILAKNHEEIPKLIQIEDTARFVGCLHCKTQYEMQIGGWHQSEKRFAIGLIVFLVFIFVFNTFIHQFFDLIPHKMGLFWAIINTVNFYNLLTISNRSHQSTSYPLKLKKA